MQIDKYSKYIAKTKAYTFRATKLNQRTCGGTFSVTIRVDMAFQKRFYFTLSKNDQKYLFIRNKQQ